MSKNEDTDDYPLFFSLGEIASWKIHGLEKVQGNFKTASIPSLQRGLVWEPKKHELLWDSLLRGFPIGALVVTPWLDSIRKRSENDKKDYHLLDGQQRCHAIALGFDDPFVKDVKSNEVNTILWLDLQPSPKVGSARNFWIRATTTAHPWGYKQDDEASRLETGQIQNFLKSLKIDTSLPGYQRPTPLDLWPAEASAKVPVPLGWLMRLSNIQDEVQFWSDLAKKAKSELTKPWAEKVVKFCESDNVKNKKQSIYKAVRRTIKTRIVALEALDDFMEPSEQENLGNSREDVSNIEQLFVRLNTLGTKIDGEELAYSMIKANWPELEEKINEASKQRMPPSRMVSLAVRVALSKEKDSLHPQPNVSRIRSIAKKNEEKKIVQTYIDNELCVACERVNDWLSYNHTNKTNGLLPVLITSIAINSRDVYLLLLYFANQRIKNNIQDDDAWRSRMRALATTLHWFSIDKTKAVNHIFETCAKSGLSIDTLANGLTDAIKKEYVHPILPPYGDDNIDQAISLSQFITLPIQESMSEWSWNNLIGKTNDEIGNLDRQRQWNGVLNLPWNRELLIYAQRAFIAKRFENYNPERKDLWHDQDRPWDFDHILASKYYYNKKDNAPFRVLVGQWANTIGNLRAWPAADNRSDQAVTAKEKINGNKDMLNDSFLNQSEEDNFSFGDEIRWDAEKTLKFISACRDRLLRIYGEWYRSVGVDELFASKKDE